MLSSAPFALAVRSRARTPSSEARNAPRPQSALSVRARAVLWGMIDVKPAKRAVDNPSPRRREQRPFESWAEYIGTAAAMGLPAMLDQLNQPILEWRVRQDAPNTQLERVPGATALHLWAPNFTTLDWKQLIALHDHDAIGEFRQKLVEAEQTISGLDLDERELALKDIG
jgi:hypothetical protein